MRRGFGKVGSRLLSALTLTAAILLLPQSLVGKDAGHPVQAGSLHEIFFYPSISDESLLHQFDKEWIVKDATIHFPVIDEMSGISIIIAWAQLCPEEDRCDFEIIDKIVDYWSVRGKKVILCISPFGAPIEKPEGERRGFLPATPEWVLKRVVTYKSSSNNFIGVYRDWKDMANSDQFQFQYPRYDDPRFIGEIRKLVLQLGRRYDGNKGIAYMRIATGKSGEDNPYGRVGSNWFTNAIWINYSKEVVSAYLQSFHKTQLEFDLLWTAIVAAGARNATPITHDEQLAAQAFLDSLVDRHVYLTYDGIAPQPIQKLQGATAANPEGTVCAGFSPQADSDTPPMDAAAYAQLMRLRKRGVAFGLEGNALADPCQSPTRIEAILRYYKPTRFVFFDDAAALVNLLRAGDNDLNRSAVERLTNAVASSPRYADLEASQRKANARVRIQQLGSDLARLMQE
jgi:hypothetical protein